MRSQTFIQSFDPAGVRRASLKRAGAPAIRADMTRVIRALAAESADGSVVRDELYIAGFTNAEIAEFGDDAVAAAAQPARARAAA